MTCRHIDVSCHFRLKLWTTYWSWNQQVQKICLRFFPLQSLRVSSLNYCSSQGCASAFANPRGFVEEIRVTPKPWTKQEFLGKMPSCALDSRFPRSTIEGACTTLKSFPILGTRKTKESPRKTIVRLVKAKLQTFLFQKPAADLFFRLNCSHKGLSFRLHGLLFLHTSASAAGRSMSKPPGMPCWHLLQCGNRRPPTRALSAERRLKLDTARMLYNGKIHGSWTPKHERS